MNALKSPLTVLCWLVVSLPANAQTLYSIGNPTNEQQSMLELINRARADGVAEAARLGLSGLQEGPPGYNGEIWTIATVNQPLSWNPQLQTAAQNHATNLNNGDQFFLGVSPHTYGGLSSQSRISAAGYSAAGYTGPTTSPSHYYPGPENVSEAVSQGSGPYTGAKLNAAILAAHNGLFTDLAIAGRGHRNTTMLGFYREIGIGISVGKDNQANPGQPNGPWDSLYTVQNFGSQTAQTPLITGVVYQDRNGNRFYDVGEGLGGVRVDVAGTNFYALTAASGGYTVPVSGNGLYTIIFNGGPVARASSTTQVAGSLNAKVDYLADVLGGILDITQSGTNAIIRFQTTATRVYRLERKLSLTDPTWQTIPNVADLTATTTGTAQITDSGALNLAKAFYRVRVLP